MASGLSERENLQLGGTAALIEGILLQPTMYWKNAKSHAKKAVSCMWRKPSSLDL